MRCVIFRALIVFVFSLWSLTAVSAESWPWYPMVQRIDHADLIVVATLTDEAGPAVSGRRLTHMAGPEAPVYFGKLKVEKVLKGRPPVGGVYLCGTRERDGTLDFTRKPGTAGIWFLEALPGTSYFFAYGPWGISSLEDRDRVDQALKLVRSRSYGRSKGGLAFFAQPTAEQFLPGTASLFVGLKNVSGKPVTLTHDGMSIQLEVRQQGKISRILTRPEHQHSPWGYSLIKLEPAQIFTEREGGPMTIEIPANLVEEPGSYEARVVYSQRSVDPRVWSGEVTSAWVSFEIDEFASGQTAADPEEPEFTVAPPGFKIRVGQEVRSMAFSRDGTKFAIASNNATNVWDLETQQHLATGRENAVGFVGSREWPRITRDRKVILSPDGRWTARAAWRYVQLDDRFEPSKSWRANLVSWPVNLKVSPDDRYLAVGGSEQWSVLDFQAGKSISVPIAGPIRRFRFGAGAVRAITEAGEISEVLLPGLQSGDSLVLGPVADAGWSAQGGWRWVKRSPSQDSFWDGLPLVDPTSSLEALAQGDDIIVRALSNGHTWAQVSAPGRSHRIRHSAFSQNGKKFAFELDGQVRVTGVELPGVDLTVLSDGPMAFTADEEALILISGGGLSSLDTQTGQTRFLTKLGPAVSVDGIDTFHNARVIVATEATPEGASLTLRSSVTGELLAHLFVLDGQVSEWAAFTPDGRFDGTALALEYVSWVDGSTSRPLTEVGTRRSGLVRSILEGGDW